MALAFIYNSFQDEFRLRGLIKRGLLRPLYYSLHMSSPDGHYFFIHLMFYFKGVHELPSVGS